MKEDYVSFELAKKLKEKGYPQYHSAFRSYFIGDDIPRIAEVGDVIYRTKIEGEEHLIACPTIPQVLKWLRETKSIHLEICMLEDCWACPIIDLSKKDEDCDLFAFCVECLKGGYKSYEEAAIAGVNYVLDNLI